MTQRTEVFRLDGDSDPTKPTVLLPARYEGYREIRLTADSEGEDNALMLVGPSALDGDIQLLASRPLPDGFTHVFPLPEPILSLEATRKGGGPVMVSVEYKEVSEKDAAESLLFDPDGRYETTED